MTDVGRTVVVGPGRMGTLLAAGLRRAGVALVAAAGGSPTSRERFARRFAGVAVAADAVAVVPDADLVLLTVPDDVIETVARTLAAADALRPGQRVVHVAGSVGTAPLRAARLAGARVAACHPSQTAPAGDPDPDTLVGVAWAVTCHPDDRGWAHDLVTRLGGDAVDVAEGDRVLYHAALTVGSNAVGAAVAVARHLLLGAGVDRPEAFLDSLVATSADNAIRRGALALTGPVSRGDVGTVRRHLEALRLDAPDLGEAYRLLARVVLGRLRPELDPGTASELEALLAGED